MKASEAPSLTLYRNLLDGRFVYSNMKENKKLVLWILGGLGAAAFTYAVYKLLKEQKPKKKIEFAPIEEKKELKWLAEEKKRRSGEKIEEKKSEITPEAKLLTQATQEDKSIKSTEKKEDAKSERPKSAVPKTKELEKIETPKESPAAPSPIPSNPNTPTKGVNTANEIKSEYFSVAPTPIKMLSETQPSTTSVYASVTGSNQSTPSSASSSTENPKSSKRRRLSKRRRRTSQRSALTPENKKDPEEELLKATKEGDSKDEPLIPKFCECKGNKTGVTKDDEQLFDAKIKYKMELAKIEVDYYPYQPINLLTPIEGDSELCRDAWDVSTFVFRPTSYLSPLEEVLDAQKCAAMQAEVIDKMIKYGEYEDGE